MPASSGSRKGHGSSPSCDDWSVDRLPSSLRVALVLPAFFPHDVDFMGGGDRYVHKLSQALTPYCDVTFFTFGPSYREELLAGVRHVVLPGRPGANPDNPVPSSLAFASSRFDVVHAF